MYIYKLIPLKKMTYCYKKRTVDVVSKFIIDNGINGSFLEIGAGDGTITTEILNYFNKVTIIEPNNLHNYKYEKLNSVKVHNVDFLKYNTEEKYDFILCSHVMCYVDPQKWKDFITKIKNILKDDGVCIIFETSSRGKFYNLLCQINPEYVKRKNITSILNEINYKYETIPHKTFLKTKNIDRYTKIIKYYAIDDSIYEKDKLTEDNIDNINNIIKKYVISSYANNYYLSEFESDMIIIS